MHRRMRQLSLTETNTFVNLAKHALETLDASDDEEAFSKDGVPAHYSDEANNADDYRGNGVDNVATDVVSPISLKITHSEPVFRQKKKQRLGMVLGYTEETGEEIEMENRWLGSTDMADDDMLQFVARSTSDIDLESVDHRDNDENAELSGDETTHLARAKNVLHC